MRHLSKWLHTLILAVATIASGVASADGLRVENAQDVNFTVAEISGIAKQLGLSRNSIELQLVNKLESAGLRATRSESSQQDEVLLVDIVVQAESYYVSLDFWRLASYSQPQGETSSSFVTVWQDYAVGTHGDDAAAVYATVAQITDRFISQYSHVNGLGDEVHASTGP